MILIYKMRKTGCYAPSFSRIPGNTPCMFSPPRIHQLSIAPSPALDNTPWMVCSTTPDNPHCIGPFTQPLGPLAHQLKIIASVVDAKPRRGPVPRAGPRCGGLPRAPP